MRPECIDRCTTKLSIETPGSLTATRCFWYDVTMRYALLIGLFVLTAAPVSAFSPQITEATRPYEITTIEEAAAQSQNYLGELDGFPVMYEVTSDESFTLQTQVHQRYRSGSEPLPFSLIAIRQNERGGGVTEVARMNPAPADWQKTKSSQLGMSLWESPVLQADVEPGTYQIEISTPANEGTYLLSFGASDSEDGYFASLAGVQRTQQFFGLPFLMILALSYVYYPLGVILVLLVIQRIWKYRKLVIQHDT